VNDNNPPAQPGKEGLPSPQEELVAYLDGELDAADRKRVEARLAEDPELRAALEQHQAISAALASPGAEAGLTPEQTLARVQDRLRRERAPVSRTRWIIAAAAAIIFAVLISARLITDSTGPGGQPPEVAQRPSATGNPTEVIAELDVLEAIQEEGGELSLELVNLLLEDEGGAGVLDSGLFDDWLEEEISGENF
jgi:anti-sigma factor RsiW